MFEIKFKYFSLFSGLKELLEIYQELDLRVEFFKKKAKINCIKVCGKCCKIPSYKIETSVLELIPTTIHLWEVNEAEIVLENLYRINKYHFCIFYDFKGKNDRGHFYIYSLRPLICRLFGFSAKRDKSGRTIPIICSIIKEKNPGKFEEIQEKIRNGLEIPINSYYGRRIILISNSYGRDLYPINEAIKIALEIVWI